MAGKLTCWNVLDMTNLCFTSDVLLSREGGGKTSETLAKQTINLTLGSGLQYTAPKHN